jgi:hypothetical protein
VISKFASANLDISLPFIDVIQEEDLNDISFVESVIQKNRLKSVSMRKEIREYAKTFDWKNIVEKEYLPKV